jgi:chromosome segregation ATPase
MTRHQALAAISANGRYSPGRFASPAGRYHNQELDRLKISQVDNLQARQDQLEREFKQFVRQDLAQQHLRDLELERVAKVDNRQTELEHGQAGFRGICAGLKDDVQQLIRRVEHFVGHYDKALLDCKEDLRKSKGSIESEIMKVARETHAKTTKLEDDLRRLQESGRPHQAQFLDHHIEDLARGFSTLNEKINAMEQDLVSLRQVDDSSAFDSLHRRLENQEQRHSELCNAHQQVMAKVDDSSAFDSLYRRLEKQEQMHSELRNAHSELRSATEQAHEDLRNRIPSKPASRTDSPLTPPANSRELWEARMEGRLERLEELQHAHSASPNASSIAGFDERLGGALAELTEVIPKIQEHEQTINEHEQRIRENQKKVEELRSSIGGLDSIFDELRNKHTEHEAKYEARCAEHENRIVQLAADNQTSDCAPQFAQAVEEALKDLRLMVTTEVQDLRAEMKSVPHEASASKMQASSYDDELRELVMKHERLISQVSLDGSWYDFKSRKHKAIITGNHIVWPADPGQHRRAVPLLEKTSTTLKLKTKHSVMNGWLRDDGHLQWDDGEVWIKDRASQAEGFNQAAEEEALPLQSASLGPQEQAGALPPADLENRLSSRSSEELESKHSATLSAQSDRLRRVDADMTRLHTSLHQRHSDIRERVLSLEKSHEMDKDKNEVACRNVSIFGDKLTDLNARVHEMEEALKASHGEKNKMHERMSTLHSMHDQLQSRLLDTSISGSEARASFGLGEDEQPASRQVLEQVSKLETEFDHFKEHVADGTDDIKQEVLMMRKIIDDHSGRQQSETKVVQDLASQLKCLEDHLPQVRELTTRTMEVEKDVLEMREMLESDDKRISRISHELSSLKPEFDAEQDNMRTS